MLICNWSWRWLCQDMESWNRKLHHIRDKVTRTWRLYCIKKNRTKEKPHQDTVCALATGIFSELTTNNKLEQTEYLFSSGISILLNLCFTEYRLWWKDYSLGNIGKEGKHNQELSDGLVSVSFYIKINRVILLHLNSNMDFIHIQNKLLR